MRRRREQRPGGPVERRESRRLWTNAQATAVALALATHGRRRAWRAPASEHRDEAHQHEGRQVAQREREQQPHAQATRGLGRTSPRARGAPRGRPTAAARRARAPPSHAGRSASASGRRPGGRVDHASAHPAPSRSRAAASTSAAPGPLRSHARPRSTRTGHARSGCTRRSDELEEHPTGTSTPAGSPRAPRRTPASLDGAGHRPPRAGPAAAPGAAKVVLTRGRGSAEQCPGPRPTREGRGEPGEQDPVPSPPSSRTASGSAPTREPEQRPDRRQPTQHVRRRGRPGERGAAATGQVGLVLQRAANPSSNAAGWRTGRGPSPARRPGLPPRPRLPPGRRAPYREAHASAEPPPREEPGAPRSAASGTPSTRARRGPPRRRQASLPSAPTRATCRTARTSAGPSTAAPTTSACDEPGAIRASHAGASPPRVDEPPARGEPRDPAHHRAPAPRTDRSTALTGATTGSDGPVASPGPRRPTRPARPPCQPCPRRSPPSSSTETASTTSSPCSMPI